MMTCQPMIEAQEIGPQTVWPQFLDYVRTRCSPTAFGNWLEPIDVASASAEGITLRIPNIFFKEYLLSNFQKNLPSFLPLTASGEPNITFVIEKQERKTLSISVSAPTAQQQHQTAKEEQLKRKPLNSKKIFLHLK